MGIKIFVWCVILFSVMGLPVLANNQTTDRHVILTSSTNEKNEIPIILNELPYKEFQIEEAKDENDLLDKNMKPVSLLSQTTADNNFLLQNQ